MPQYSEQLQKQALIDLTNRAKSGIALYPAIWLVIALSYQIHLEHPAFFYINSAILCCIFISRIWHLIVFRSRAEYSVSRMLYWLVFSVLVAGFQWGVMSALMLWEGNTSGINYVWVIATMGFAIGGAIVLSISNAIRVFFPLFLIVPSICILALQGGLEQWIFATSGIIILIYVHTTTRVTNADYWEGIKNRFLAEQRAKKMELLSQTDQLTQLNNRMLFDKKFAEEWKRSSRSGTPLSILMLDLDYFKVINDSYGHVFGDECLRRVAETLLATIQRETDSVARYGGEEFVILLPDTNQQDSETIATRVLLAISNIGLSVDSQVVPLTCSIGVATGYAELNQNREILLKSADDALYLAKNRGRNRVQIGSTINA